MRNNCNDISMKTTNFIIQQSNKIKILGVYVSSSLSNIPNINNVISKVNYRLHILKKVFKYTNKRTSKMLMNSIILSIFKYFSKFLSQTIAEKYLILFKYMKI